LKVVVPIRPISSYKTVDKKTGKLFLDKNPVDVNPNDKAALVVALDLRVYHGDTEVVAISVGGESSEQVLREALAYGVNRAVQVEMAEDDWIGHARMAWCLAAVFKRENFDIAIFGNYSPDELSGEIAGLAASLLKVKAIPEALSIDRVKDKLTVAMLEGKQVRRYGVDSALILSLASTPTRTG
jgi:electron transfer flavoprotein beta subunit